MKELTKEASWEFFCKMDKISFHNNTNSYR